MNLLRIYGPDELHGDGYPLAWHGLALVGPSNVRWRIPDVVRSDAGWRCERCGHPYKTGDGEWSACGEKCDHAGPIRIRFKDGGDDWEPVVMNRPEAWTDSRNRNVEAVEAQWRVLTVHHLNGVKYDCRWWNLVALCQRCHLNVQRRVVMERAFILEHSEWFKPYAAGWYAEKYLGLELSREETLARLDELLALERLDA